MQYDHGSIRKSLTKNSCIMTYEMYTLLTTQRSQLESVKILESEHMTIDYSC